MTAIAAAAPTATPLTVRVPFHVARPSRRIELRPEVAEAIARNANVPRITKFLALAHHWQWLLDEGAVRDYAELARQIGVTRARLTQIMDLLLLAPDIQEEILLMSGFAGRETMTERHLRPLTRMTDWCRQRQIWALSVVKGATRSTETCQAGRQRPPILVPNARA